MSSAPRRKKVLMCPPDHYGVAYVINPWMEGQYARTDTIEARRQWLELKGVVERHAEVCILPSRPALPDLVFTANAGLAKGKRVVVSRFRAPERRGEEPHFRSWFAANGFEIIDPPKDLFFEGAGDALHDETRDLYWVGHGFRSHKDAAPFLEKVLSARAISLTLVDPRFYHLDTCLSPLPGGYLMYFPGAFDAASRETIETAVPEQRRICVDETDAEAFCCNAVALDDTVVLNDASPALRERLRHAGLTPSLTPLTQFMKAGGAAKCLTLDLD
jgi:N-dimethylarginine dimethylaminohydrolase